LIETAARTYDESHDKLGKQGFYEPCRTKYIHACPKQIEKSREGKKVEGGAQETEFDHETANETDVPPPRLIHKLRIDASFAIPTAGMSEKKLLRRICPAPSAAKRKE